MKPNPGFRKSTAQHSKWFDQIMRSLGSSVKCQHGVQCLLQGKLKWVQGDRQANNLLQEQLPPAEQHCDWQSHTRFAVASHIVLVGYSMATDHKMHICGQGLPKLQLATPLSKSTVSCLLTAHPRTFSATFNNSTSNHYTVKNWVWVQDAAVRADF